MASTEPNSVAPARAGLWLARAPSYCAAAALFALMAMTFADVILRSVANAPIEAATELTRILMAVVVFASLPVISARGDHVAVDLFDFAYGETAARIRDAVVSLASGAMLFWPAERCLVLAGRARDFGEVTEYLAIPQHLIIWFIAGAIFITGAVLVVRGGVLLVAPKLLRETRP